MLTDIVQEMKREHELTGCTVQRTLARGLTLTLTDMKISLTRRLAYPSSKEEEIVLQSFGYFFCARSEWVKGDWHVISYMYFDLEALPTVEAQWVQRFAQIVEEKELPPQSTHGYVAKQVELFSLSSSGMEYYE